MSEEYCFHAIFDSKMLNKALMVFQHILERKSSISNLSNIKITLSGENAVFIGININIAAIKECMVVSYVPGEIVINAYILYDIVRKINYHEVEIYQKKHENLLTISAGNSLFKIPVQEVKNFPLIDTQNFETECLLKKKDLIFLIDNTIFASAVNDVRYFLCSIKIIKEGNKIEAVATDGHRLGFACVEYEQEEYDDVNIEIIIPRKTAQEISKQLKDIEGENIRIAFSKQKIGFFLDDEKTIIISKLISGNYPNYKEIMNDRCNCEILLSNKILTEAVERSLILLDEKNTKAICLTVTNDNMTITAQSDTRGSIFEMIDKCQIHYNNEQVDDFSIMINAYYLHEIAKNIKGENVVIYINDKKRPILIREENNLNKSYYLMPMSS